MKRENYISWAEYFMGIALLSAQRSKDSGTQTGSCIVSGEQKILSLGYNGMPTGCMDDSMPWGRDGEPLETKYMYECHSELNAILNSGTSDLRGSKLYTTHFPCNECAKAIIQSGITQIVYLSDQHIDSPSTLASKKMFDMVGVKYTPYRFSGRKIELDL